MGSSWKSDPAGSPVRPPVLLLEDEPIQGMLLVELIEEAGCEAVEVRTAQEAIAVLETRADIRVVVADLDVRGSLMGLKLAAMIRDRWPPIELILTGSVAPKMEAIPARGVFRDKPFERASFVKTVWGFVQH